MSENRVVIYSNGIADFQRCYEVSADASRHISIAVRQDHLADVLASFNVYGNVKLDSPPTFRPSNELEGNITINPQKVLEDLATNLSGAKVRVERTSGTIEGTLVGLHQEEEATTGEPIHPNSMVVLAADGLRECVLREIQTFKFLDDDVQAEIDKALQRNYQRIRPNSTFVELVLSTAVGKPAFALARYEGEYRSSLYGDLRIVNKDQRLALRIGSFTTPLLHWENDVFYAKAPTRMNYDWLVQFDVQDVGVNKVTLKYVGWHEPDAVVQKTAEQK